MAKILVVDDETSIVSLIAEVIIEHNHSVLTALNGRQALDVCLQEKPDLVISDIMMPGLDGYQLCRQIRNHPQLGATKVALMTAGFFNPASAAGCFDEFIKKPFDIDEIEQLLARIFSTHNLIQPLNNSQPSNHP